MLVLYKSFTICSLKCIEVCAQWSSKGIFSDDKDLCDHTQLHVASPTV